MSGAAKTERNRAQRGEQGKESKEIRIHQFKIREHPEADERGCRLWGMGKSETIDDAVTSVSLEVD
jgi:hypothetical protein